MSLERLSWTHRAFPTLAGFTVPTEWGLFLEVESQAIFQKKLFPLKFS